MIKQLFLVTLSLLTLTTTFSQNDALKNYIDQALESNIALKRQELSYAKSLEALKEAKAMFLPSLSLNARYSVAQGGRAFEFPVGDLMNPVYQNLNLLNNYNQAANPDYPVIPEYPEIPNQQVNFLRSTEHETFFRLAMPVFNSAIIANNRIKDNLAAAEKMTVDAYKRELVKEVKVAYYNYAKALKGVELYQNTLDLVKENLRTTESLYRNHKITIDQVYAAKAEVEGIEQNLAVVNSSEKAARSYFNFLLNRNYDESILLAEVTEEVAGMLSIEEARQQAFRSREEFQQLNYILAVSDNNISLQKGEFLPSINLVADYGYQGTNYAINSESDYLMGSIVMSWNIFDRPRSARVQQARIDKEIVEQQKAEVHQQVGLEVVNAYYALEAAYESVELGEAQVESATKALRLVNKKYNQGQVNQVEFTDARTRQTTAERRLIIAKYEFQIKLAELERATASYTF